MYITHKFLVVLIIIGVLAILVEPSASAYYWIHKTTLVLEPIPRNVGQGDHITFSGRLLTADDETPLSNRLIFKQYESPYDRTTTLTSTTTDTNGYFIVSWTAKPKGYSGGTYNIFAKFNGDDENFFSLSHQYLLTVTPALPKINESY